MERALLDELSEFLRIPSVSADPAHRGDVAAAGEWVRDHIRRSGGSAEVVDWEGQPLVVGEIAASADAAGAPTIICYGHFDVQPVDPLDLWESPPFEPTIRGEWLYARGIADDKGQLWMLLKAAELLAREGRLPVNVRFLCDGEEEVGGQSIIQYLDTDENGGDAAVIFDSSMLRRGVPAFDVACRGLCYFHVRVRTGEKDLHSGMFGGAALNATHALMQALSGVLAGPDGRVPEALWAGVAPPSAAEVAAWAQLDPGAEVLAAQGATPADPRAAQEFYLRVGAAPAVDVNGLEGGSPQLVKTVLPVLAEANVSIRLAPGQRVDAIAPVFERLVREAAPEGARVEVELSNRAEPGLVPPDARAIQLGLEAFERAVGTRPLLVRSGGSLPIVEAFGRRGIPTIITGFDLPEGNIHSPNERLLLEYLPLGVEAARELFLAFGALRG